MKSVWRLSNFTPSLDVGLSILAFMMSLTGPADAQTRTFTPQKGSETRNEIIIAIRRATGSKEKLDSNVVVVERYDRAVSFAEVYGRNSEIGGLFLLKRIENSWVALAMVGGGGGSDDCKAVGPIVQQFLKEVREFDLPLSVLPKRFDYLQAEIINNPSGYCSPAEVYENGRRIPVVLKNKQVEAHATAVPLIDKPLGKDTSASGRPIAAPSANASPVRPDFEVGKSLKADAELLIVAADRLKEYCSGGMTRQCAEKTDEVSKLRRLFSSLYLGSQISLDCLALAEGYIASGGFVVPVDPSATLACEASPNFFISISSEEYCNSIFKNNLGVHNGSEDYKCPQKPGIDCLPQGESKKTKKTMIRDSCSLVYQQDKLNFRLTIQAANVLDIGIMKIVILHAAPQKKGDFITLTKD